MTDIAHDNVRAASGRPHIIHRYVLALLALGTVLIASNLIAEGIRTGLRDSSSQAPTTGKFVHVQTFSDGWAILNTEAGVVCFVPKESYGTSYCRSAAS